MLQKEATRVTLLATSVTASTFEFSRSWTHIDKLVRRDKVLYDVCRRVFNAHTPILILGRVWHRSDVLSIGLSSVFFLKVPNGGSQIGVQPCVAVVTSRTVLVQVAARIWAS